ncbi:MAG: zonular occludens toxin domain-containing protein [Candidatus Saccharimonadales bacterium]
MAVYFITGKLGCGKTLCAVGRINDYLQQGRRVATNLDIKMEALTKPDSKVSIIRVPDKPSQRDLIAMGEGAPTNDESTFGLLVLDELAGWFNSRNWRDKDRLPVIQWFRMARKLHWDILLIVQDLESLDSQLVNALCEHLVVCKRTDRLTMPIIGPLAKTIGIQSIFPKVHVAKVYYGQTTSAMQVDRWWYRGKHLYGAYDTDQKFLDEGGENGNYSILPAYYVNNIALIERHRAEIQRLSAPSLSAQPAAGRSTKVLSTLLFIVGISLIGQRTYAKYEAFTNPEPIKTVTAPGATTVPKAGEVVQPVAVSGKPKPLDGYQIRLLGTTLYKNGYHMHIELAKDGRKSVVSEADLVAQGYEWRMVSSCSVVLSYKGDEMPIFCTVPDQGNSKV